MSINHYIIFISQRQQNPFLFNQFIKMQIMPPPILEKVHRPQQLLHYRHKSEATEKQLNKQTPWNQIGKALTQRYNQKFISLSKQRQQLQYHIGSCVTELSKSVHVPKFQIKRKYLSFNFKDHRESKIRDNSEIQGKIILQKLEKSQSKLPIVEYYKNMKESFNLNNQQAFDPDGSIKKFRQTVLGDYFIPTSTHQFHNPKNKCIYIKRNTKKISLNPELKISKKKRQIKQQQDIKISHGRNLRISNPYAYLKCNRKNIFKEVLEKKMFRPWSGHSREETL